jgi:DNA-binding NtrC family response regulator
VSEALYFTDAPTGVRSRRPSPAWSGAVVAEDAPPEQHAEAHLWANDVAATIEDAGGTIVAPADADVVCVATLGDPTETVLRARALAAGRPVVVLAARPTIDGAVAALRGGATEYLRTITPSALADFVARTAVRREPQPLPTAPSELPLALRKSLTPLLGQLGLLAASDVPVLIMGETGTGKDNVARALHTSKETAFVSLNCSTIPESSVEEELFGAAGAFHRASGGTLFLDEIGALPLGIQGALLRTLEERKGNIEGRVRLVAATHEDLSLAVEEGRFREDLYFRISGYELEVPPVREHPEELNDLFRHFLPPTVTLSPAARALLERYRWPGNLRELQNVLRSAAFLAQATAGAASTILATHLPARIQHGREGREAEDRTPPPSAVIERNTPAAPAVEGRNRLADLEREALQQALLRAGGDIGQVVRELGIGRTTVYRKIKEYRLDRRGTRR